MGDRPGHEFHGNQWTTGSGRGVRVDPARVDKLSLAENKAEMREMVKRYREDADFRGAATVVALYSQATQRDGLATRAVVSEALKGKTPEQILATPKVQKAIAELNAGRNPDYREDPETYVKTLAEATPGYLATVRDAEPTTETVYRGAATMPKGITVSEGPLGDKRYSAEGDVFMDLAGPTAFSHNKDSAMTYAGKVLIEVEPGAKMLPVQAMARARRAAEAGGVTEEHSTVPAFYRRSDQSAHPLGSGHGYAIDFDSDRELSSAGRFKVVGVTERRLPFVDGKSGNTRLKTVVVVRVKHVGVF